jgi:2-polyprenyl-6-methoxyphenol hydroxylase-like FAD-dependent oxidoreductase
MRGITSQRNIAIIGAGIGGLAVSACLRKLGIESTIYEQAANTIRTECRLEKFSIAPQAGHQPGS